MQTVYSTKQANRVVSKETYQQIAKTTAVRKKPVSQSNHDAGKNHLSNLERKTMYTEKEIKMFDLDRQYLLISALQKSIRWCEVNESRYFARELLNMGVPGVALNRLLLIAAEDVGLADPTLLKYVRSCLDNFENLIKQHGIKRRDAYKFPDLCDIVDRAAIAAAVSYKSRLLDLAFLATLYDIYENEEFNDQLPDYLNKLAMAVENKDEKQALYYAFVAGLFLNSMDKILKWIQKQGENLKHDLVREWVEEYKRKHELLVFTGSIVMLCRDFHFKHGEFHDLMRKHVGTPIKKAQIPDRAYDMHTRQGRKMGRGLVHFFKVGATVKNERFTNDWQQVGETACFRAEKNGVLKTEKIIKVIEKKFQRSQKTKAVSEPLTF
jgi:hypothetical protein